MKVNKYWLSKMGISRQISLFLAAKMLRPNDIYLLLLNYKINTCHITIQSSYKQYFFILFIFKQIKKKVIWIKRFHDRVCYYLNAISLKREFLCHSATSSYILMTTNRLHPEYKTKNLLWRINRCFHSH